MYTIHDGEGHDAKSFGVTMVAHHDITQYLDTHRVHENGNNAYIVQDEHSSRDNHFRQVVQDRQRGKVNSWLGNDIASMEDAYGLLNQGWADGAVRAGEMAMDLVGRIEAMEGFRIRAKWSDTGEELDPDRAIAGEWDVAWQEPTRRRVAGASNIVTLAGSYGGNSNIDSESLFWSGAQMIAVTDLLERAGYRVELMGASHTRFGNNVRYLNIIHAKGPDEPLRPDALASVFSNAGVYRTIGFELYFRNPVRLTYGIGHGEHSVASMTSAFQKAHEMSHGHIPMPDVVLGEAYNRKDAVKNILATIRAVTGADAVASA